MRAAKKRPQKTQWHEWLSADGKETLETLKENLATLKAEATAARKQDARERRAAVVFAKRAALLRKLTKAMDKVLVIERGTDFAGLLQQHYVSGQERGFRDGQVSGRVALMSELRTDEVKVA